MLQGIWKRLGFGEKSPIDAKRKYPATRSGVAVSIDELIALKAAIRGIRLTSTRVKNSSITGAHTSRFRGRGMDYQESRAYQPVMMFAAWTGG
ncbi:MAG: hypothetical protein GXP23_04545 [Gammaproteobacteria bacterium]|nr:hypothetical protein [Gammaproteobacteria bacterium]